MRFEIFRAFVDVIRAAQGEHGALRGLSGDEIDQLREQQNASALPYDYRLFLEVMGKEIGSYRRGTVMTGPLLAEAKNDILQASAEHGQALPGGLFVFACHQGYDYWFFEDLDRPSTTVWNYFEPRGTLMPCFKSFSEWLEVDLLEYLRVTNRLLGLEVGASTFDHRAFRTIRGR